MDERPHWFPNDNMLFGRIFQVLDGTDASKPPPEMSGEVADLIRLQRSFVPIFDGVIDDLRNPHYFPNPIVNKLITVLWRLIGSKTTPLGVTPAVKSMHFYIEHRDSTGSFGSVVAPPDWPQQFRDDPYMAMGGLVFIASQANDFYHRKFMGEPGDQQRIGKEIRERALAYEADFYMTVQRYKRKDPLGPVADFRPNDYQQKVMAQYPMALFSLPARMLYPITPVMPGDFDEINRITMMSQ